MSGPGARRAALVVAFVLGLAAGGLVHVATGGGLAQAGPSADGADADGPPPVEPFEDGTSRPAPAPDGVRQITLVAEDRSHPIFRDVHVPVVALNGTFPGPTIRALEGDRVEVTLQNDASLALTLHFHGFHAIQSDGVHEVVRPGQTYTYELQPTPPGVYLYHSHVPPLALSENRVASGVFIVDPAEPRPPAKELVMISKFDDTDGIFEEAEFYTFNGVANRYLDDPIEVGVNETLRLYMMNVNIELHLFHVHGTIMDVQTMGNGSFERNDNQPVGYAERFVMEMAWPNEGLWMFHDHIAEHMERGMMGWVKAVPEGGGAGGAGGGA